MTATVTPTAWTGLTYAWTTSRASTPVTPMASAALGMQFVSVTQLPDGAMGQFLSQEARRVAARDDANGRVARVACGG